MIHRRAFLGTAAIAAVGAGMLPHASHANLGMPVPAPPFDRRRLVNVERAYRFMDEQKLDALVALNPVNIFYLTNFVSYRSKMAVTPFASFAVFPRNPRAPTGLVVVSTDLWEIANAERDYPEMVVPYTAPVDWEKIRDTSAFAEEPSASPGGRWPFEETGLSDRERAWHALDQRWFGKMAPTPEWALVRILRELGLTRARVAVDDMRIDRILTWSGLTRIASTDGDNLFRKIRLAKSEPEIAHMRQAARINQDAAMATLHQLEAGATRADIDRIFMVEAAKRGGKSTWIAAGTPAGLTTPELRPGQSLLIDTVCQYNYYHGDFGRTFVLGEPSEAQKRRARIMERGWRAAFETIKPGIRYSAIRAAAEKAMTPTDSPKFAIGVGPHSVGLQHTDEPYQDGLPYAVKADLVLEENMTLTVDFPSLGKGTGNAHLEDLVRVTRDGAEVLGTMDGCLIEG